MIHSCTGAHTTVSGRRDEFGEAPRICLVLSFFLIRVYFHVWKRRPARASKVKAEEYLSLCKSLKNGLNLNREAESIGQKGRLIPAKGRGKDY